MILDEIYPYTRDKKKTIHISERQDGKKKKKNDEKVYTGTVYGARTKHESTLSRFIFRKKRTPLFPYIREYRGGGGEVANSRGSFELRERACLIRVIYIERERTLYILLLVLFMHQAFCCFRK